jgi:hypothetical protein
MGLFGVHTENAFGRLTSSDSVCSYQGSFGWKMKAHALGAGAGSWAENAACSRTLIAYNSWRKLFFREVSDGPIHSRKPRAVEDGAIGSRSTRSNAFNRERPAGLLAAPTPLKWAS